MIEISLVWEIWQYLKVDSSYLGWLFAWYLALNVLHIPGVALHRRGSR